MISYSLKSSFNVNKPIKITIFVHLRTNTKIRASVKFYEINSFSNLSIIPEHFPMLSYLIVTLLYTVNMEFIFTRNIFLQKIPMNPLELLLLVALAFELGYLYAKKKILI